MMLTREEIAQQFEPYHGLLEPQAWHSMLDAFTRPLPSTMWIHPQRVNPEWLTEQFTADGHHIKTLPYVQGGFLSPKSMKWGRRFEFRAGLIHLQEASSMLPPLALQPEPGELVLDLCAAPGGKSAQLALMMQNQGTLVVNDLSFSRLRALRATQERLGLKNMVLCAQEGQKLLKDHPAYFDKVLVDAPCSCEGTLRKRGKWSYTPDEGNFKKRLIATQKALLLQALKLTKPNGRVVYSTCTLDPLENEGVLNAVLEQWQSLKSSGQVAEDIYLEPIEFTKLNSSPGISTWQGQTWSKTLKQALRVYPHQNDSGGFFLAALRKSKSAHYSTNHHLEHWSKPKLCTSTEQQTIYSWAEQCFGLGEETWNKVAFTEAKSRYLSTISKDLLLPPTRYQVAGLPSVYVRGAVPRLTSAAVLEWGGAATRSVIDLDSRAQVDAYYAGQEQALSKQAHRGICIPRYKGYPLGTAHLKASETEGSTGLLKSEYSKRLRLAEGHSAFEGPVQAKRS